MEQLPRRLVPVHVGDDVDHEVRTRGRRSALVFAVAVRRPASIVPPSRRRRRGRDDHGRRIPRGNRPSGEAVLVAVPPPGEEQPADRPGDATEDARRDYRTQDALSSALLPLTTAAPPPAFRTAAPALPPRAAAGKPARFRKRRHPPRVPRRLEGPGLVYHGRVRRVRRIVVADVAAMPAEARVPAAAEAAPAVAVAIALARLCPPPVVAAVRFRRVRRPGPGPARAAGERPAPPLAVALRGLVELPLPLPLLQNLKRRWR